MSPGRVWRSKHRTDSEMRIRLGIKEAKHLQEQEEKHREKNKLEKKVPKSEFGSLFQIRLSSFLLF